MPEILECHICGVRTDFVCRDCSEPVCEDCCIPMTLQNQIDYALCSECYDSQETAIYFEAAKEQEIAEKAKAKKKAAADKRRATYWKPENIEKRRLAKLKHKQERAERNRQMLEAAAKAVADMFRGMF